MLEALIKNKHGAVFARGMRVKGEDSLIRVGLAFCNPKDFPSTQLSRKEWWQRLRTIAKGRMITDTFPDADMNGRAFRVRMRSDENFKDKVVAALFEMAAVDPDTLAESVPDEKSCMPEAFGLREFSGKMSKCEFRRWMRPFIGMLSQQYRSKR